MYDAIVVGAGPGGATSAALMAREGLRVLLVDKAVFPRDKICGDAISGKSVDALRRLGLTDRLMGADSVPVWGVTFSGTKGDDAAIPLTLDRDRPVPPGFVCRREIFDHLLVEAALEAGAEVWQETTVEDLLWEDDRVVGVRLRRGTAPRAEAVRAPLVVGADGAYSIVARKLGMAQLDEGHYVAALRAYYHGVGGFHEANYIELHFIDEVIPGYFWIFPLPDGGANVGLGMLSSIIKKKGIRLKPLLDRIVEHPRFRDRFAGARREGPVKGWGLPLGSKPRTMAGAGWMLVGDAASLIDPFSGEGIGNAMVGGDLAAQWTARAHAEGDFSAAFLRGFEREVVGTLRSELQLSYNMQRLAQWKGLLNLLIRKAARSPEVAQTVTCMFDDLGERKRLVSPGFYLRMLTA